MNRLSSMSLTVLAACAALGSTAAAQVTPTHTFETPLKSSIRSPRSVIFAIADRAAPGGESIWNTELHVHVDHGRDPARVGLQLHDGPEHQFDLASGPSLPWVVTGTEPGLAGDAAGTYTAVTSTRTMFNDTLVARASSAFRRPSTS